MDGELLIRRLQAQLRASAGAIFEAEDVPPFVIFINPDDAGPHANCAIPFEPGDGDLSAALDELVAYFTESPA